MDLRFFGQHCGTRSSGVAAQDAAPLSCYNFDRWVQRKIIHQLYTGRFNRLGILAGYGGDILSPQAEVPFFYPCGIGPLYAAWDLYLMRVHC